jgi:hypothetical protein
MWTIRIEQWPESGAWQQVLRDTLKPFIDHGALVAWCGLEGRFADPPSLFHPNEMTESVWVALTKDGQFFAPAALDEPFRTLSDQDLVALRKAAHLGD